MTDCRKPLDCKYYPLCRDLQLVSGEIPVSFSGMHDIALQKEAESICSKCPDYVAKEMAGAA